MTTFETLSTFESAWRTLTRDQQGTFRRVVTEQFEPDLTMAEHGFRPSLRVRGVPGFPGLFEMAWDIEGRATFSYGSERAPGQPHVIWHQITTTFNSTPNWRPASG